MAKPKKVLVIGSGPIVIGAQTVILRSEATKNLLATNESPFAALRVTGMQAPAK